MKHIKLFEHMNESDFMFSTKLSSREISFYDNKDNKDYDDIDDINAIVHWSLRFDWLGDEGVDYYVDVNKIDIEYNEVKWVEDGEDILTEKTLTYDDPNIFNIEKETNNNQIIVHEIEIYDGSVTIIF